MNIPRPEFPNPQFQRAVWMNLNGEWDFKYDNETSGESKGYNKPDAEFDQKIVVPFCPESKLSGIGNTDFILGVWYKRTVTLPEIFLDKRIVLHFGACDFLTKVYIDGELVGTHKGGYSSFNFDITKFIKKNEFTITVYAKDDTREYMQSTGKQSYRYASWGCFYTRTTGLKPVLLMDDVLLELDPDKRQKLTALLPEYEQLFCTFLPGEPYERYMKDTTKIYKIANGEWYE